jgi:hypothetical protein
MTSVTLVLISFSIAPPQSVAQQQPSDTPNTTAHLIKGLNEAVAQRAQARNDEEKAAALARAQEAARAVSEGLRLALIEHRDSEAQHLVRAMRAMGATVFTRGTFAVIHYPKSVWEGLKEKPSRGGGITPQSDFCYDGWSAVDESTILTAACFFHQVTYYCSSTQEIMNCSSISCGGGPEQQSCREPILLINVAQPEDPPGSIEADQVSRVPHHKLLDKLNAALLERDQSITDVEKAAAEARIQMVSRSLVDAISRNLAAHKESRAQRLIRAVQASNISVQVNEDKSVIVRFPRSVWKGLKARPSPESGITPQSDFCYSGWSAIDSFWVGTAVCSTRYTTYYCSETHSIMTCHEFCGAEDSCGEPILLLQ